MTDWTAIARALQKIDDAIDHTAECVDCLAVCDRDGRVREAQAKAVLRAIEAAMWCAASHGHMPDVGAALRALDTTEALKALRGIG